MPPKEIFEPRTSEQEGTPWVDAGHSVREQIHYIGEATRPNAHHREMAFLRHLMLYGDGEQRRQLEEKINRSEGNERCTRRAVGLMVVLIGMSLVGLGYGALLLEDFPPNTSQFVTRIFCALGLAALVSLMAFVAFWLVSRGELNEHREGCRRLVTKIVAARLGKPADAASPPVVSMQPLLTVSALTNNSINKDSSN